MVDEETRAGESRDGIEKEPRRFIVLWRGISNSWLFNVLNIAAIVWFLFGGWLVRVASNFLKHWFRF